MKRGWKVKVWADVLEIRSGRNQKQVISSDGTYPILGSAGKVMGYATEYLCEANTTIIGRKGTIDKPLFIETNFWNVDTAFGLVASEELNNRFLHYFCLGYNFQKHNKGTTLPSLVKKDLVKIQIPVPPLSEQEAIVEVLDKAFTAIDQAKANLEQNIANAKELFQSKLNQIFSQKGEGWVEKTLGDVGEVQTGTTPPTKDKTNYGDFLPFVKPAHFRPDGSIVHGDSMLSKSGLSKGRLFQANSVLMVCIGATIGKTGFTEVKVSSNQQINALTPTTDFIAKLLYYALISPYVQHQVIQVGKSAQATLPIINKSKWQKLSINIPTSLDEQKRIVNNLEDIKTKTMQLQTHYQTKLASLDELKKSILQKAFAGELT